MKKRILVMAGLLAAAVLIPAAPAALKAWKEIRWRIIPGRIEIIAHYGNDPFDGPDDPDDPP